MAHPLSTTETPAEDEDIEFRIRRSSEAPQRVPRTFSMIGNSSVRQMAADHISEGTVRLEFDDVYVGQIQEVMIQGKKMFVPHGIGTLHSENGGHKYKGEFDNRLRQGIGVLETPQFSLHTSWNNNRPATSRARMDYQNGDRYMGHLLMETRTVTTTNDKSKFTQWLKATDFFRHLWGEMVYANGDSYFGQWSRNDRHGFGVMVYADGGRYTGSWNNGKRHGIGAMLYPNGVLFEGEWRKDERDSGALLCPSGCDVRANWKGSEGGSSFKANVMGSQRTMASVAMQARLCNPDTKTPIRRQEGCALPNTWTSLFNLHKGELEKEKTKYGADKAQDALGTSGSRTENLRSFLHTFLHDVVSAQARHPLASITAVFKRIFYFLYGSCGSPAELGSGTKTVKARNNLSWCSLKKHSGGCYHTSRGQIQPYHIHCAVDDVLSFVEESLYWVREILGPHIMKYVTEFNLTFFLSSTYLDLVLPEVFTPLMNLYSQAYRESEHKLQGTFRRLGVVTLDDLGVGYARSTKEESLFTPYADAITGLQNLINCSNLSGLCKAVSDWSLDIDRTSRIYQLQLDTEHDFEKMTNAFGSFGSLQAVLTAEAAGADDLFPIHLYTFVAAKVTHVIPITEFLTDMGVEENYFDPHGAHNFCIAMLKACITHAFELHRNLREKGVMVPTSLFHSRMRTALCVVRTDSHFVSSDLDWVASVLYDVGQSDPTAANVMCSVPLRAVNDKGITMLRVMHIHVNIPIKESADVSHSVTSMDTPDSNVALVPPNGDAFVDTSPPSFNKLTSSMRLSDMMAPLNVTVETRFPNFLYLEVADTYYALLHLLDDK